jgi:TonB family protein
LSLYRTQKMTSASCGPPFANALCARAIWIALSLVLAWNGQAGAAKKSASQYAEAPTSNIISIGELGSRGATIGSGVLLTGGKLLTDCHILGDATRVSVRQWKASSDAELAYADRKRDLCELRVDHPERFHPAKLTVRAPNEAAAGDTVYAVGSWNGVARVSKGRVVKLETRGGDHIVLISSRLAPEYNGGGLFDAAGALVGIVTHRERSTRMLSYAYPAQYVLVRRANEAPSRAAAEPRLQPSSFDAPASTDGTDLRTSIDKYLSRLSDTSRANLKYPEEAREQGWGGTATIRFDIDTGGEVRQSFVDASSGYAGLDVAALLAVRKALEQLSIPETVREKGLKGTVSITFTAPSTGYDSAGLPRSD